MSLTSYKRRAEAVTMEDQTFEKMDLRSMKAFGSTWTFCIFKSCEVDLTDWRGSKFQNCTFIDCGMRMVNFSTSFFQECRFTNCDLEQASFMGSHFRDVKFEECRMAYGETMFQDATVKSDMEFYRCNLHGSNLDFREVAPKALRFSGSNLWGAKISMGCAIFNGVIDERLTRQFLALVARASQDSLVAQLAGDQYEVVCRAMGGDKECRDTTISQATTSTPILNFPDQTDETATATTTLHPTRMMESS